MALAPPAPGLPGSLTRNNTFLEMMMQLFLAVFPAAPPSSVTAARAAVGLALVGTVRAAWQPVGLDA